MNFILDRTFNRPRDVVVFLQILADNALGRGRTAGIQFIDLTDSAISYSAYLLGEVEDICGSVDPRLVDVVRGLPRLGRVVFHEEELSANISSHGLDLNASNVIGELLSASVIGVRVSNKRNIFKYHHTTEPPRNGVYIIHKGLMAALGLAQH